MESGAITGITVIIEGDSGVESVKISSSSQNVKNMLNKIKKKKQFKILNS